MRKAIVAERILELVTSSSYASSIVGDLLEESSDRNALWFWMRIFGISLFHVLQALRFRWLRMTWLALSGLMMFYVFPLIIIIFSVFLMAINGLEPYRYLKFPLYIWSYLMPLLAGRNVAKRSNGFEVAAGVALTFLMDALFIFLLFTSTNSNHWEVAFSAIMSFSNNAIILAAALWVRYSSNVRHLPSSH